MATDTTDQTIKMLPGDEIRQIMWRFADRYDIQMGVMGARSVARGIIARLVAAGARDTHEWTPAKNEMYQAFDDSGITAGGLDPDFGGTFQGSRNLALALLAYEIAWVDGGAATSSLVNNLALGPIVEKGTPEQRERYMRLCCPPQPGENRKTWRGSFALTEPLPYVGVDTGVLNGRVTVAEWKDGQEPLLKVEKRGRFITNMAVCDYVTAAVDTGDPRIKSSCMVILEATDPGVFDRGSSTKKMVHQLSNTHDPIFSLTVPASRIVGGYTVKDGVIVPNLTHSEIIEAVFARTRVTVGVMSAAKLLSAVEPVIRYQRGRFRGVAGVEAGTPRHDLGIQMKEDAIQRLADVWATGEAAASLGMEAARGFDAFMPVESQVLKSFKDQGISGRGILKALRKPQADAVELFGILSKPAAERDTAKAAALQADPLVQYAIQSTLCHLLCPACKLWDTGHGANVLREAVSLMGGYGITEDCPGFLFQKWTDAQLEATYEGPEVVQRREISVTMNSPVFLAAAKCWIAGFAAAAQTRPGRTGAEALAAGFTQWLWLRDWLASHKDANGRPLEQGTRHGVVYPLADALAWLLAARSLYEDVRELEAKGKDNPVVAADLDGTLNTYNDLASLQAAAAAGEVSRIAAELFYGFETAPAAEEADFLKTEQATGRALAGARLAKDRIARALTTIMIPEALDYPQQ